MGPMLRRSIIIQRSTAILGLGATFRPTMENSDEDYDPYRRCRPGPQCGRCISSGRTGRLSGRAALWRARCSPVWRAKFDRRLSGLGRTTTPETQFPAFLLPLMFSTCSWRLATKAHARHTATSPRHCRRDRRHFVVCTAVPGPQAGACRRHRPIALFDRFEWRSDRLPASAKLPLA
jgi:hypothetical protein